MRSPGMAAGKAPGSMPRPMLLGLPIRSLPACGSAALSRRSGSCSTASTPALRSSETMAGKAPTPRLHTSRNLRRYAAIL